MIVAALLVLAMSGSPDAGPADAGSSDGAAAPRPHERPNVVVVFKKGVTEAEAEKVLEGLGQPFHSGGDSSRGKMYFYANGPQYLVTVPGQRLEAYLAEARRSSRVHEAYQADWDVQKD